MKAQEKTGPGPGHNSKKKANVGNGTIAGKAPAGRKRKATEISGDDGQGEDQQQAGDQSIEEVPRDGEEDTISPSSNGAEPNV